MDNKFIHINLVNVYDDKVFTQERITGWKMHIIDCYDALYEALNEKISADSPIRFFISKSLLNETIIDAIIGMRKITDSQFNNIEDPNAFKIASYITYWWLRHKPVSIHYPGDFSLEDVKIKPNPSKTSEENEYERQKVIWQLKHINELVAVEIAITYIFDFDVSLCGSFKCKLLKVNQKEKFCFKNFEEMKDTLLRKLTYYFAYRTIAPKVIEHLLEAYTFHPAWGLTGPQWETAKEEGNI